MSDVLVVGAGLAGLTAAYRLASSGIDVVVVEARGRVGGRVWTRTLDNGELAELGGEWIAPDHTAVIGLATELGLDLVEAGVDFGFRQPVARRPLSRKTHERLLAAIESAVAKVSEGDRRRIDADEFLGLVEADDAAVQALRMRLQGSAAVPLSEVGLGEILGSFGVGAKGGLRVAVGNQALAQHLAQGLPDVRFDTPVTSIDTQGTRPRLTVGGNGGTLSADWVIVAVPLPVLADFDLPEPLTEATSGIGYGTAAKLAVATTAPPDLVARQDMDEPAWYWTGRGATGVRRCVTSFVGTRSGVENVMRSWHSRLSRAVPAVSLAGQPLVVDWGAEEWSRGCYSALRPGRSKLLDVFAQRWGRLIFAGEHTSASGSMNGAIASGRRAADLAARLLGGDEASGRVGTLHGGELGARSDEAD